MTNSPPDANAPASWTPAALPVAPWRSAGASAIGVGSFRLHFAPAWLSFWSLERLKKNRSRSERGFLGLASGADHRPLAKESRSERDD